MQVVADGKTTNAGAAPVQSVVLNRIRAAEYVGLSVVALDQDRVKGRFGIPFVKMGRSVRYRVADLDAFLERSVRCNTSEITARKAGA